ncbi:helix-turn-helix domain-containing protein [Streptomyces sp. NPDC094447]|uniref:helix-turn-helix domain-containing protein n=1 Tax=Streptomyces sp. NPDC094447 TaxID=3366062 RepID=UPI0037FD6130
MIRDPEGWARLGQAFATARKTQGLTQDELARLAGVSLGSVQNAEAGQVPKARMPQSLYPIAKALNWPDGAIDDILRGGAPPGGWTDVSVQKHISEKQLEVELSHAMVRAAGTATGTEIEAATKAALDVLREHGLI